MRTILFSTIVSALVLFSSCQRNEFIPILNSLTAYPESILPGESSTLSCQAVDYDGDQLQYLWSCAFGTFPVGTTKPTITWVAPDEIGSYTIEIRVSDGEYSVIDQVDVEVYEEIELEGTFEYDGREYRFATLGEQTWMIENLAYLPLVNNPLDGADDQAHYYVYDYHGSVTDVAKTWNNYKHYGVLYNWDAAMTACPEGWHLPSDEEWKTLEKYLGMLSSQVDEVGWRDGGSVGRKLKSSGGWRDGGNGDNSSGFGALPGGLKSYSGKFADLEKYGNYWSSTTDQAFDAWYRWLGYEEDGVNRNTSSRRRGFSVRCVRD